MRQFKDIFKFETSIKFKQKSFIISVIITFIICFGMTFAPTIVDAVKGDEVKEKTAVDMLVGSKEEKEELALCVRGDVNKELMGMLEQQYKILEVKNEKQVKKKVRENLADGGLILDSPLKAKVISHDKKVFNVNNDIIPSLMAANYKYNIGLKAEGLDPLKVKKVEQVVPDITVEQIGKNPIASVVFAYVGMFVLYFLILLLGGSIAMTICREKESRTMELLVTNVSTKYLIWGKVLSGVFLAFFQCAVMILSIGAGLYINSLIAKDENALISMVMRSIKPQDVLIFFILSLIGTTMYYFLFAAIGSLVTKLEEINSAMTPVTLLVVFAFLVPVFNLTNPEGVIMKVTSFIPFSSPLAMFARFTMSDVAIWELALSIGILLVTTVLISGLSIKIYRMGTLNYGNKMGLFKAIKKSFAK